MINGCISTNSNQSVLQYNENIRFHLQLKRSKFKVTPSAGKVIFGVFWDSQRILLARFQKRGQNVNSDEASDAIRRKRPDQLARGVLLQHDNARPHTASATQEIIQELQREVLEYAPYRSTLALTDFHLFGPRKEHLGGKRYTDDEEVETELRKWLRQQSKDFCAAGVDALVKRWDNVSMLVEDMSRNKCFSQVGISHVYVLYLFVTCLLTLPRIRRNYLLHIRS
jgi:histone-lysine N-methyltransferase SETMAR